MDPWLKTIFTGLRLHSEGWRSTFCNPDRPAFLGDAPVSLIDLLVQQKRWTVGVLEVVFLKCSLLTFGSRAMGPLAGPGCSMCAFYPIYSIKRSRRSNSLHLTRRLAVINKFIPKTSGMQFIIFPDFKEYH